MKNMYKLATTLLAGTILSVGSAFAGEKEIGEPVAMNGLDIAAVYLQPVKMAPMDGKGGETDVHLEADISAAEGNPNGFSAGDWVPYLTIAYNIRKVDSDWSAHGSFLPMVADDGPHYGANVKLDGPGEYELDYEISSPVRGGLFRHTDEETGVGEWFPPFHVNWTFAYVGVGKKGTY